MIDFALNYAKIIPCRFYANYLTYKYNWSYILKYTLKLFFIFLLFFLSTSIFAEKNVQFVINTTKGNIVIETYPEKAPITVKNFESYVNKGFYNGTIFHRVIDGFMIQGGGFTKDMSQKKTDAPIKNEADNGLKNLKVHYCHGKNFNTGFCNLSILYKC